MKLPCSLKEKGIELLKAKEPDAICLCSPVSGKYEFPNPVLEKQYNISSTTRNWNTVRKIAKL